MDQENIEELIRAYKRAGERPDYDPLKPDAQFDTLLIADEHLDPAIIYSSSIPPIAHTIFLSTSDATWCNWLTVKGAILNLGAKKVKIWIPREAELAGDMWQRIQAFKEVEICRVDTPKSVYGVQMDDLIGATDVQRLKIVYEEGGIHGRTDILWAQC